MAPHSPAGRLRRSSSLSACTPSATAKIAPNNSVLHCFHCGPPRHTPAPGPPPKTSCRRNAPARRPRCAARPAGRQCTNAPSSAHQLQRAAMHAGGKQPINFQVMPAAKVTVCARGAGERKAAFGAEGRPAQLHRRRTAGAKRVARNPACHAARRNEEVHAFPKDLIHVDSDARSEEARQMRGRKQRVHGYIICYPACHRNSRRPHTGPLLN